MAWDTDKSPYDYLLAREQYYLKLKKKHIKRTLDDYNKPYAIDRRGFVLDQEMFERMTINLQARADSFRIAATALERFGFTDSWKNKF